jgi:CRP/FNR family transcriptional regulator, nitrogen fixation regulation protein
MLIESALQNGASSHRLESSLRQEPPVRPYAFAGMGSTELMAPTISLRRNAEIYRQNDRADHFYKVVSGTVRTCRVLIDGRRQIGAFYLPGDLFGLETDGRHAFSAEAVIGVEVMAIKRNTAAALAKWDSEMRILMGCELRRTQDHLLLLIKTAPERVASFLLEMAERIESGDEIDLPMPRQDIADYLGLTIETVSRTLTQLENQSAIALPTSKRIVLRNRTVLKRLNS